MFSILTAIVKLAHAALITCICIQLSSSSPILCLQTIALELGFTVISIFITKNHKFDLLQIAISLFLTYTLIPNKYSFLSGLFFFKIIYVFNAMGEALDDLFSAPGNSLTRIMKVLLNLFRYTLAEYLFLGLVLLAYKVYTMGDPEGPLAEDYLIFYTLIVTASTIGYGDITPKTKWQFEFLTYSIPFICASFVVYFNAVIPVIGELIDVVTGVQGSTSEGCNVPSEALNAKLWNPTEREAFVNFIDEVARRQAEHEEHHKRLGHNWIAISANHYERQILLINEIVSGSESKQIRLKISSKVRRQYYPAGWTIIHANDSSEDLMMVDEGEVKVSSSKDPKKNGYVFNSEGFKTGSPVADSYTALTFVSIWAISLRDLESLGKSSAQINSILQGLR